MERIDHPTAVDIGGGRNGFRSKDTVAGQPGTVVTAKHLNDQQEEIVGLIEKSGLTPDGDHADQLLRGIRRGTLAYLVAGGTGNALTAALDPAPLAGEIVAGTRLLLKITAANTGAATLNLNAGVSVAAIKTHRGAALSAGALVTDDMADLRFDGAAWRLPPALSTEAPVAERWVFSSAGTATFTPTITGWYLLELWGGGGGGGAGAGTGGGGGGGGGGRVIDYVYLIAGTAYTYTVGSGGNLGAGANNAGSSGGASSFVGPAGTIVATQGGGGSGANTGGGGAGGAGGAGSGYSARGSTDGAQSGYQGSPQISQGGQGGSAVGGGYGGAASFGTGNSAGAPGGGGSGSSGGGNGGQGANGRLIISRLGA